ncbi:MAG TPA: serine/threonine-protein kinase [Isosphaeraceae bacterium]|nr:serine/threonine-protein kinase [Isosphaeraceae bacterium]
MATTQMSKPAEDVPSDLLKLIKKSGVLSDRQFEDLRTKVLAGDYPLDTRMLAQRLIRDRVLTEYQAGRLLKNKPHGLAVGKYVILDRLGSGSMGRVYKANHLLMGRVVALKVIAPEISSNSRVVSRFQREMKLVGRLDHPNVVRAYDADQLGSILYIVMEYVSGHSLGQIFRERGPLRPIDVARYAADAALGLAHAHAQGIVHRDIKPSNLLLGEDRRVRVLDLGLGVLVEVDEQATFATADGIAVGTVDYMSPEQACGREVDGRSDLYSLGCTMYHIISGRHVFPGNSPVERLGQRINGTPTPLADLVPDLPAGMSEVMDRLLANKPRDRYQTAEEAAEALERLLPGRANLGRPAARATEPSPAEPAEHKVVEVEVEVEPDFPAWFRPLAELAENSPLGAAIALLLGALVFFGLGFFSAFVLLNR